jgi:hypothetical protein
MTIMKIMTIMLKIVSRSKSFGYNYNIADFYGHSIKLGMVPSVAALTIPQHHTIHSLQIQFQHVQQMQLMTLATTL